MPGTLAIGDAVVAAIVAHATRDLPHEACGLLIGTPGMVVRAVPTANGEASPSRYAIPATEHFSALRAARAEGRDVIGAYHSHPRGAAVPSASDTAEACADFVFVIAGLEPAPHVRAWQLDAGNFVELRLVRT